MRKIQINYDLSAPGRNYTAVEAYIKSFRRWNHLLESTWVVETTKTAASVRDEMKGVVDSNDRVVVFDVTHSDWATNFSDERTTWLKAA